MSALTEPEKSELIPWKYILKEIITMAIPATACLFLVMIPEVINVFMISKLNDPVKIAAVGQGNALINIFGFGVFLGLSDALVTLSS